ncbi:hypothetical protein BX666DRAFT_1985893 [Dichotomocladium elegans]|nr:hypothetical protein BX666DRAFT_1985893 [Dichotomocladium elegans]
MPIPVPECTSSIRRMSTITIPNQDICFESYYDLDMSPSPSSVSHNPFESRELEATYCRDFFCCGHVHPDLHALLQHYEECHVEDDEDYEDEDDDVYAPIVVATDNDFLLSGNNPIMTVCATSVSESTRNPYALLDDTMPADDDDGCAGGNDPMLLQLQKKRASVYVHRQEEENDDKEMKSLEARETTTTTVALSGTCRKRPQSALDLLTQSAAKRLAVLDEDLLLQASALLASTSMHSLDSNADKPYKCSVPGCQKAYKNPNGLKYHNQHGHCDVAMDEPESIASKPYQCTIGDCGKRYKNLNGLKYHIEHSHMAVLNQTLAALNASFLMDSPSPSDVSNTSDLPPFF